MSITRDEIARLCAGHDRFMAEHHDWMARRQAALAPLAQKSDPEGLLYRVHDDGAPAPSPEPVLEPSEDHDLLGHAVNVFAEAVQSRFDDDKYNGNGVGGF